MTDQGLDAPEAVTCLETPGDCNCYFCSLFELLGRKWTLHTVGFLSEADSVRFNELKRMLDGISPRTLSDRLSELEEMGLIERIDHGTIPPKVEYRLTEKGEDLDRIYETLMAWADRWDVDIVQPPDPPEDEASDRDRAQTDR